MQFGLLQIGLLIWQIIGVYFIINDDTLSPQLKVFGIVINLIFFFFILVQVIVQPTNILTIIIGLMLFVWYVYYTPIDFANPGYTSFQRFCYVAIDIVSLIYLIYTVSAMILNICHLTVKIKLNMPSNMIKQMLLG